MVDFWSKLHGRAMQNSFPEDTKSNSPALVNRVNASSLRVFFLGDSGDEKI